MFLVVTLSDVLMIDKVVGVDVDVGTVYDDKVLLLC